MFLKLECNSPILKAETDYTLWGDYTHEEFAERSQGFTVTTRQLQDIQALSAIRLSAMERVASTFSRRLLLEGSETIFLKLEALNRPGRVIKRQQLNRGTGYGID